MVEPKSSRTLLSQTTRLSPAGQAVSMMAAVGIIGGWALGWIELVIVGCGAMVALVVAALWLCGPMSLTVDRRIASRWVTAGSSFEEVLRVTNPGRLPTVPVIGSETLGDQRFPVRLPSIASEATHEVRLTLPTRRRGVVMLGPAWFGRTDPLGLLVRETSDGLSERLVVHPRIHRVELPNRAAGADDDVTTSDGVRHSGGTFRGVRGYETGDDVRAVHWRSTAKRGELMVRQYGEESQGQLAVLVDTHPGSYGSVVEFELAVEIAASLLDASVRQWNDGFLWATQPPDSDQTGTGAASLYRFASPTSIDKNRRRHLDICAGIDSQASAPFSNGIRRGLDALAAHPESHDGLAVVITGAIDDATLAATLASDAGRTTVIRCTGGVKPLPVGKSAVRTLDVLDARDFQSGWAELLA